jgi:hypothetical protein
MSNVQQVKTLLTTSREVADYITEADLWWERVLVADSQGVTG